MAPRSDRPDRAGRGRGRAPALRPASLVVLIVLLGALLSGGVAGAGDATSVEPIVDGAELASVATYRFDPDRDVVEVVVTYSMTNVLADRDLGGGAFEFFFFEGLNVPVHSGLADLRVQVDGLPADVSVEPAEGLDLASIEFPSDLRFGDTFTIEVAYDLLPKPPRTPDDVTRVNDAYGSFDVFVFGDGGAASVTVVMPDGWEVGTAGSTFTRTADSGQQVYEATGISDPLDFGATFAARNDPALSATSVEVSGADFVVRAWPGDRVWRRFARQHLESGVPALEDVIGLPWPESEESAVYEASSVYLDGYVGFHDVATNEIEVGEYLDTRTLMHELAHAWFHYPVIQSRWVSEGITELAARTAIDRLDIPVESPAGLLPAEPDAPPPEPFPLNQWSDADVGDDLVEQYGYETSARVVRRLAKDLDDDTLTALLRAVARNERAYPAEVGSSAPARPVGWREFLDLAEQIGGSTNAESLYRRFVVAGDGSRLDARRAAVERYRGLAERGGDWLPPEAVRGPMAGWHFDEAAQAVESAHETLDLRDELRRALDTVGLEVPADRAVAYHQAVDLEPFDRQLRNDVDDAQRLVEAWDEVDAVLASLGLAAAPLVQDDYEADPAAVVVEVEGLLTDALALRDVEEQLTATLRAGGLDVPDVDPAVFFADPESVIADRDALRVAAEAVVVAQEEERAGSGPLDWLGRLGSDVDGDIAAAASRLAAGDADGARAAADSARAGLEAAASAGPQRAALLVGVVAVFAVSALVVRGLRRRRSSPDDDPSTTS